MELISRIKAVKQNTQDDVTYEMLIRCTSDNTSALFRRLRFISLLFCFMKASDGGKKVGRKQLKSYFGSRVQTI